MSPFDINEELHKDMQNWWDKLAERRKMVEPRALPVITSEIVNVRNEDELKAVVAQKLRNQISPNSGTMPSQGSSHV